MAAPSCAFYISVPFEEVLGDILEHVDNGHMGVASA